MQTRKAASTMHSRFAKYIKSLHPSLERLIAMPPVKAYALPANTPASGIYLLSDGHRHLYVGRSRRLRSRIQRHSRPGASYRSAAFAFQLAREMTGHKKATYKTEGSRRELSKDPKFAKAFQKAKDRIRQMDVRYVREPHPLRQALLEMYAAVALGTRYNDFDTH